MILWKKVLIFYLCCDIVNTLQKEVTIDRCCLINNNDLVDSCDLFARVFGFKIVVCFSRKGRGKMAFTNQGDGSCNKK